jgi:hypothetical protein
MEPKPTNDQLSDLRQGLRKRKVPGVFNGMWCSQPGIGGARFIADGDDFKVEWVTFENGQKSTSKFAGFHQLCDDPSLEMQRLEVGYVIANIQSYQGQEIANSIGDPNEAAREAKPYWNLADSWRHWALVSAGHMIKRQAK